MNIKTINVVTFYFLSSALYQLSDGNSLNKGALQENFLIKLKAIKNECEANTANLLTIIEELRQNKNTTLIDDLKKLVQELNKTVADQQQMNDKLNRTVEQQEKTIAVLQNEVEALEYTAAEHQNLTYRLNSSLQSNGEVLSGRLNNLEKSTDVHFTVRLTSNGSVPKGEPVKFIAVVTNVGDGYVDNSSHIDYGKFVAPISGTYQFFVTITKSGDATISKVRVNLVVNSSFKVNIGAADTGTCHLVIKLGEGDKVWVEGATYNTNYFQLQYTFFSGNLIHEAHL